MGRYDRENAFSLNGDALRYNQTAQDVCGNAFSPLYGNAFSAAYTLRFRLYFR